MEHFADRLRAALVAKKNALCVGLDPRWESLPTVIRAHHKSITSSAIAAAYEEFCQRVIQVVGPLVPVIKLQSAFFEACGPDGMVVQQRLLRTAKDRGLITILDAKRNDIASTATAYADAAFAGVRVEKTTLPVWDADALTVNPYLGRDAVEPFLESARAAGRGVFVLVRTSNPGAGLFQDLVCEGKPVYEHVAAAVETWSQENVGDCGLGDVGAVVGATYPAELAKLRQTLAHSILLVPGFGAQGASARDTAGAFLPNGLGAIINSSRGIIYAFGKDSANWEQDIERATRETIAVLKKETPMIKLATAEGK
jgi:orotidine-5'-phosphate decarboxylase